MGASSSNNSKYSIHKPADSSINKGPNRGLIPADLPGSPQNENKSCKYWIKLAFKKIYYILRAIFCIILTPLGGMLYYYLFKPDWQWAKNEIASQIIFAYTTLIAVLWSTLTVDIIQRIEIPSQGDIYVTIIYIVFVYCIANMLLCFMLRQKQISKYLSLRMGFIVGIIGHILGFGLKNLSIFVLQYSFLKENHWYRWLYLFLQICCFIIYTWLMSIIRPKFCFVMKHLEDQTNSLMKNVGKQISQHVNVVSSTDFHIASVKGNVGGKDLNDVDGSKKVIYESDLYSNLMEIADAEQQSIEEIERLEKEETREEIMEQFEDYTKEIDGDAWLISIGFMWVDIIFLLYQHKYFSLTHQEIDENDVVIEDYDWENAAFYGTVFLSIFIFWYIYSWLCSYFQVHRDRCIMVEFGEVLSEKHKQSRDEDFENFSDDDEDNSLPPPFLDRRQGADRSMKSLAKHNKCTRCCIRFSLKYVTSETVFMFMDGTCGWCFGWSYVYIVLNMDMHKDVIWILYLVANVAAILVTIVFILRMWLFRRGLKQWMRESIRNADGISDEIKELHLNELNKAKEEELDEKINEELTNKYFNFANMTYTNHSKLFHLLHANWFWRRALAS